MLYLFLAALGEPTEIIVNVTTLLVRIHFVKSSIYLRLVRVVFIGTGRNHKYGPYS